MAQDRGDVALMLWSASLYGENQSCTYASQESFILSYLLNRGDEYMILLEANQLMVTIRDRVLFDINHLQIQEKDRIGLVGRNGSGKTTLLNVLAEAENPSKGNVISHASCVLLPQLKSTDTAKSGGEITQGYINKAIAKKSDILFADEPTTNLDTKNIEKLENHLKRWHGAFVLVSHDRVFLDSLCTTIWELDDGNLKIYQGNYSNYVEQKELEQKQHETAYEQYQYKKKQLERALELKEQKAQRATKKPTNVSASEAKITGAKPYFANKQKKLRQAAKAIETRLEKLEKVDKIKELPPVKMDLPNEDIIKGRIILRINEVAGKVENRFLWKTGNIDIRSGDKIAILGRNGTGKTTFLRKILNKNNGIAISPAIKIGYFSQNLDVLDVNKTILENVSSTSIQNETLMRTVLARLRFFRDDVYKKVDVLSGGERVKVAFAKLFVSDINTLLLDEPTNFLDIEAMEALEELLRDYGGTILLVSHDRRFITTIANRIFTIENQKINVFNGTYEAYKGRYEDQVQHAEDEELLVLQTKITEALSKLSIEPSVKLEKEFAELLARKKELER